jgi:hypothetical protein
MEVNNDIKVNPIYPIEKNKDKSDEQFRREQFLKAKKAVLQKDKDLGNKIDFYA